MEIKFFSQSVQYWDRQYNMDILYVSNKTVIYTKEFPLDIKLSQIQKIVEKQQSCDILGYNYSEELKFLKSACKGA